MHDGGRDFQFFLQKAIFNASIFSKTKPIITDHDICSLEMQIEAYIYMQCYIQVYCYIHKNTQYIY